MKILDKTKWIIVFSVCAVIAVAARFADTLLASKLYMPDSLFGTFFVFISPSLSLILASFSSAVMMACRNTRTTRTKNQLLNVFYGVLSVVFSFAAACYPFIGTGKMNFTVIAGVTALVAGASMVMSFLMFKETYQKIVMTEMAKRIITAALIISVICALALLIPQRGSYEAIRINMEKFGKADGPYESTVPFVSFMGASAPVLLYFTCLKDAIPKLKFSGNLIFILSCIWSLCVIFGSVSSGHMYLSEASYGMIIGYITVFAVSKYYEKREN